jgi:ATP-dependent Clp protease, protease subunit
MSKALIRKKLDDREKLEYEDPSEELKKKGIYYITGEIETDSLLEIHQDIVLKHLDPNWQDDLQIIVNSVGGLVSEGWALIDLIDYIKVDVKTIAMGDCSSLGACLVAAGTKGKRISTPNSSIMIHGAYDNGIEGTEQQLLSRMKYIKNEQKKDANFWLARSNLKNIAEVKRKLLDGLDHFLTAEEALKLGIIDKIIGGKK